MKRISLLVLLALIAGGFFGCGPLEIAPHSHDDCKKSGESTTIKVEIPKQPGTTTSDEGSSSGTTGKGHDMSPSIELDVDCKYNVHCPNGSYCTLGSCVMSKHTWDCALHSDCGNGEMCYYGQCVDAMKYPKTKPRNFKCTQDTDCGMRGDEKRHTCSDQGYCQSVDGGMTTVGCEIEYGSHEDSFMLYGDRFKDKKFYVLILALNPNGQGYYIVRSKKPVPGHTGGRMYLRIPDWAVGFQLIQMDGIFLCTHGCETSGSMIKWYLNEKPNPGSKWIVRNSMFIK